MKRQNHGKTTTQKLQMPPVQQGAPRRGLVSMHQAKRSQQQGGGWRAHGRLHAGANHAGHRVRHARVNRYWGDRRQLWRLPWGRCPEVGTQRAIQRGECATSGVASVCRCGQCQAAGCGADHLQSLASHPWRHHGRRQCKNEPDQHCVNPPSRGADRTGVVQMHAHIMRCVNARACSTCGPGELPSSVLYDAQ